MENRGLKLDLWQNLFGVPHNETGLLTGNGICEHTDDGPIELNMDLAM